MHLLLRRLLFLPHPSFTLDLIHRKALRVNNSNTPSRFALSTAHYRFYLLWKGVLYLYNGLLIIRFSVLACALLLDHQISLSTVAYSRLDPVLGGLVFTSATDDHHQRNDSNFRFLRPHSCLVAVLLFSISLYLDLLLHFRLDPFTVQLFQESVNLNRVNFFVVNRHLKRPPQFCLSAPLKSSRKLINWSRQLWNSDRPELQSVSFYFRRLQKYPHLSRAVRLKVMLVVMGLEKVVVASVYSTLGVCVGKRSF